MNRIAKRLLLASGVAMALALTACDNDSTSSAKQHIEEALSLRAKGDLSGAVVALKTALQEDPDNADARAVLGELYLRLGDGKGAVKELERARRLGADFDKVRVLLVRAWLINNDSASILREVPADIDADTRNGLELLVQRGRALLLEQEPEQAKETLERALGIGTHPDIFVGLAQVALAQSDPDAAKERVLEGLDAFPKHIWLQIILGEILLHERQFTKAEEVFAAAANENPSDPHQAYRVNIGLARAQLSNGDYGAADALLTSIAETWPQDVAVAVLRGFVALNAQDFEQAMLLADQASNVAPNNTAAMLVKGTAAYYQGRIELAHQQLSGYVARVPGNRAAKKFLALTQIRLGQSERAYRMLSQGIEPSDVDAKYLELLSDAARLSGHRQVSLDALQQAVLRLPEDAAVRAKLGFIRIATGEEEEGLSDLEAATELEPDMPTARAKIAIELIRKGEYEKATEIARDLQSRHPNAAFGFNLEAMSLLRQGLVDEALPLFRKALEIEPKDMGSALNLSAVIQQSGKLRQAADVLETSLEHLPGNLALLLKLAELEQEMNQPLKREKWLKQAIEANPRVHVPVVILARDYLEADQAEKAIGLVGPILKEFPNSASLVETVGRSQLRLSRFSEAAQTFRRLIQLRPDNSVPHYRLGQALAARGDNEGAQAAFREALEIDEDNQEARLSLAQMLIALNQAEEGRVQVAKLKAALPDHPEVLALDSVLLMAEGKTVESIVAMERAFSQAPSGALAIRLARMQWLGDDRMGAMDGLSAWLSEHPADFNARNALAEYQAVTGDYDAAKDNFERVVASLPEQARPRQRLAWVLWRLGDLDEAAEQAQAALDLRPGDPKVIATLGNILLAKGQVGEAVKLLERASNALPDELALKYHLARGLTEAGDSDRSRQLLSELLAEKADFPEKDAARALFERLSAN